MSGGRLALPPDGLGRTLALISLGGLAAVLVVGSLFLLSRPIGSDEPLRAAVTGSATSTSLDKEQPPAPSTVDADALALPDAATQVVDIVPLAVPLDDDGRCFATTATRTTSLTLGGIRYEQRNLQCGNASGSAAASGGFSAEIPTGEEGLLITDFSATVGIDEASDAGVSSAEWQVSYDGVVICEASATPGAPGTCAARDLRIPVRAGATLRLTQSVRTTDPARSLWAGFHLPTVTMVGSSAARADAPTSPPASQELVDAGPALDRVFLQITAGDYEGAADEAEGLYTSLLRTGGPLAGNAAFNAGVVRYARGDCDGAVVALTDAVEVPGTTAQNRLRALALEAAGDGCATSVADLLHR